MCARVFHEKREKDGDQGLCIVCVCTCVREMRTHCRGKDE